MDSDSQVQWLRRCKLYVQRGQNKQEAIDLSDFRIKFEVTQRTLGQPQTATITVYNVSQTTVDSFQLPVNTDVRVSGVKVVLSAGYEFNESIIFNGDLWWKSIGRESETDTFLKLIASTGDVAHQYAVVNRSFQKGTTQVQIFRETQKVMVEYGVGAEADAPEYLLKTSLPRGKVVYMKAHDVLDLMGRTNNFNWGYGNDRIITVPKEAVYSPSEQVIVLNAETGLIGRPEQTPNGVDVVCLLNPMIQHGSLIQLDNKSIQRAGISTAWSQDALTSNYNVSDTMIDMDGIYRVVARTHVGDTRGNDWYTKMTCVSVSGKQPMSASNMNNI